MRKRFYPPVNTLFISNLHTFIWKKHIYIDDTIKKIPTINFDYQSCSGVYTLTVTCKSKKVRNLPDVLTFPLLQQRKEGTREGRREGTKERRTERKRHFPSSATKVLCNTGRTNTEELSSAEFMQCACMHFHSPYLDLAVNVKPPFYTSRMRRHHWNFRDWNTNLIYTYLIYIYIYNVLRSYPYSLPTCPNFNHWMAWYH